ncbi:MAG: PAS domain-containing protein [Cyclobacteriaceae bacterium]|nr:PAS domain-containing protein [Cyclobacteriaceae bacterium]
MNNKILLEQSPTAIAMFDMELKYIAASLKWMEEYSLQGKNIIGLSHYEVFPEIGDDWKAIHQECLRGAVNKCEEAYFKRADGTEQWISWDVRPWYDDDDKIGGLLMYTVDITIRKVTEKKMEEERMLLRTLVNHIPLNVYVKDLKSRKMLVNKKELEYLGIKDEKDLLGKDDFDVYPYESAVSSTNEDRHVFQSGDPIINRETFSLKNDGNYSWFLTSKIPLRSTNGEIYGLVGLSHDITERKASEEKLRKYSILESKSEEMEQFAYVASHDLREPLLTIKNYIELLIEDYGHNLPEEGRRYTQSISRAANRMEELIKGLLDYSRLSRIKQLQEVDCNEIIKHVEEDLDSLISSTDTKITFGKLPTLKAYPLELNMLFQNLIDNAIKFRRNDTSPEIHISARSVRDGWKFEVRDNGLGIEKVDREKIFIMFQRLHSKNEYSGTGIGLAHCKKIAELHNGNIWVESIPGNSSRFYFTILTGSL